MTRKWILTGAAAIGGLVLVSGAWAAGEVRATHRMRAGLEGMEGRPLHRFIVGQVGRLMVLKSDMNVTDEQRAKIRAIVESHKGQIAPAAKDLATRGRALREAVIADKTDERAIRAAAGEMGRSIGEAAVLAAAIRAEVRPLLTDEQRKALDAFRAESDKAMDRMIDEAMKKPETP
ncbi:MAG: Spy/CpxP family protein refolding chaperone [Planctomycetota bacterium]|nr:Spy/CpxP family protein refolding chaperone [Planctomycetota bacterium]